MSRAWLVCAAAACIAAGGGAPLHANQTPSQTVASPLIGRVSFFEETQRWFELVQAHHIGEWDASAAEAARLAPARTQIIRGDLHMIYRLLDEAATKANVKVDTPGKTLNVRQLARLIGVTDDELNLPLDIRNLGDPGTPARLLLSRVMTRAAMMHTRIALERDAVAGAADIRPPAAPPAPPGTRVINPPNRSGAVLIRDGRQTRIPNRAVHWAIAREAFDVVGPPRAASATAKLWYRATSGYLQQERDYSALLPHLQHAREIFPSDAVVFLFSGAAYENLAAPRVQAAVDESDGSVRALGSPDDLLREADQYLRRALTLAPDFALAQLRRGRVLELMDRHDEAAALLRQADAGLTDASARYLANLFLGKAEEALGHGAEARAAYDRAMSLCPAAQSPRLALATMAWRANDRAQVGVSLGALSGIDPEDVAADPFWTYDALHVGDVPALFERLRAMAIEAAK